MIFNIGEEIEFKLDYWDSFGNHCMKKVKTKVLDFIYDPMKRHKSKYLVVYKNERYGIPFD